MEQTLFERAGIQYREVDGLLYPILQADEMDVAADVGKYGRAWMHLLYELDRMQYNKMLLDGTLIDTAILKNEIGYELLDRRTKHYLEQLVPEKKHSSIAIWKSRVAAQLTAEEEIYASAEFAIKQQKSNRLLQAKLKLEEREE
nr:TnpV protein [uncultured Anaerosporobacter sp.]